MPATLEGFRAYIRGPEEEDLTIYLEAARAFARRAGVPDRENDALYELFLYTVGALYYDSRGGEVPESAWRAVNSLVLSLRGREGEAP